MSRQLLDRSVRRPTAFAHKGVSVRPFEDSHTHLRLVSVGNAVISGKLAGVIATATSSPVSRSVATWRL